MYDDDCMHNRKVWAMVFFLNLVFLFIIGCRFPDYKSIPYAVTSRGYTVFWNQKFGFAHIGVIHQQGPYAEMKLDAVFRICLKTASNFISVYGPRWGCTRNNQSGSPAHGRWVRREIRRPGKPGSRTGNQEPWSGQCGLSLKYFLFLKFAIFFYFFVKW